MHKQALAIAVLSAVLSVAVTNSVEDGLHETQVCGRGQTCSFEAIVNVSSNQATPESTVVQFDITHSCGSKNHEYFRMDVTSVTGSAELHKQPVFFLENSAMTKIESIFWSKNEKKADRRAKLGLISALAKRFQTLTSAAQIADGSFSYSFSAEDPVGAFTANHTVSLAPVGGLLLDEAVQYTSVAELNHLRHINVQIDSDGHVTHVNEKGAVFVGTARSTGTMNLQLSLEITRLGARGAAPQCPQGLSPADFTASMEQEVGSTLLGRPFNARFSDEELGSGDQSDVADAVLTVTGMLQRGQFTAWDLGAHLHEYTAGPVATKATELLLSGDITVENMETVLAALSAARLPASYRALGQLLADDRIPVELRRLAAVMLVPVGTADEIKASASLPPSDLVHVVTEVAFRDSDAASDSALLCLGSLLSVSTDASAAEAHALLLADKLKATDVSHAAGLRHAAVLLRALGNAGPAIGAAGLAAVSSYLWNDSPLLREASGDALRFFELDSELHRHLSALAASDPSPRVRAATERTLAEYRLRRNPDATTCVVRSEHTGEFVRVPCGADASELLAKRHAAGLTSETLLEKQWRVSGHSQAEVRVNAEIAAAWRPEFAEMTASATTHLRTWGHALPLLSLRVSGRVEGHDMSAGYFVRYLGHDVAPGAHGQLADLEATEEACPAGEMLSETEEKLLAYAAPPSIPTSLLWQRRVGLLGGLAVVDTNLGVYGSVGGSVLFRGLDSCSIKDARATALFAGVVPSASLHISASASVTGLVTLAVNATKALAEARSPAYAVASTRYSCARGDVVASGPSSKTRTVFARCSSVEMPDVVSRTLPQSALVPEVQAADEDEEDVEDFQSFDDNSEEPAVVVALETGASEELSEESIGRDLFASVADTVRSEGQRNRDKAAADADRSRESVHLESADVRDAARGVAQRTFDTVKEAARTTATTARRQIQRGINAVREGGRMAEAATEHDARRSRNALRRSLQREVGHVADAVTPVSNGAGRMEEELSGATADQDRRDFNDGLRRENARAAAAQDSTEHEMHRVEERDTMQSFREAARKAGQKVRDTFRHDAAHKEEVKQFDEAKKQQNDQAKEEEEQREEQQFVNKYQRAEDSKRNTERQEEKTVDTLEREEDDDYERRILARAQRRVKRATDETEFKQEEMEQVGKDAMKLKRAQRQEQRNMQNKVKDRLNKDAERARVRRMGHKMREALRDGEREVEQKDSEHELNAVTRKGFRKVRDLSRKFVEQQGSLLNKDLRRKSVEQGLEDLKQTENSQASATLDALHEAGQEENTAMDESATETQEEEQEHALSNNLNKAASEAEQEGTETAEDAEKVQTRNRDDVRKEDAEAGEQEEETAEDAVNTAKKSRDEMRAATKGAEERQAGQIRDVKRARKIQNKINKNTSAKAQRLLKKAMDTKKDLDDQLDRQEARINDSVGKTRARATNRLNNIARRNKQVAPPKPPPPPPKAEGNPFAEAKAEVDKARAEFEKLHSDTNEPIKREAERTKNPEMPAP